MAGTNVRLIMVVVLCITYLICMSGAIPITRSINLVKKSGSHEAGSSTQMKNIGEDFKLIESMIINRRMDLELNDYPGFGSNNRHTPRRGACPDC